MYASKVCEKGCPADMVFEEGKMYHGTFFFDDASIGYVADPEFEPSDYLSDGETEDDLIKDGRRPIGNIYIDRYDADRTFHQGGCFLYYEGETMRDYCERNGLPCPVRELPDEAYEIMEDGSDYRKRIVGLVPEWRVIL